MSRAKRVPNTAAPATKLTADGSLTVAPERGDAQRLSPVSAKVGLALRSEIDAYAEAHGLTRSRAAGEYLAIASETLREREGVPAGRADEILEALEGVRTIVDVLGPPTFAVLRVLAHWACKTDLKVGEDELLAELRAVGADEWEQVVSETVRDLQDRAREGTEPRRS